MMLMTTERNWAARSHKGIYDISLVCSYCESRFKNYDQYAAELLMQSRHGQTISSEPNFTLIDKYSYRLLKLYFISVMWRASASERPEFRSVSLGPYQDRARKLIENDDPGCDREFQTHLFQFDEGPGRAAFLNPHSEYFDDIRYYRFYMGGYVALIKVDNRAARSPLDENHLHPDKPLAIGTLKFRGSSTHKLLLKMARSVKTPGWLEPNTSQ
jgi:hypothetical protein